MYIMRFMALLFASNLILWAEFKLDVPKNITMHQLENIALNGWNEENITLNHLIVEHAEKVMPEILRRIDHPCIRGKITQKNQFSVPTFLLHKEDYQFIIAYTKYLEFQGNIGASLKVYTAILQGLKNTKDDSLLYVIYTLVVERIVREGITQLLKTHTNLSNYNDYFEQIARRLTTDTSAFFKAMDREKMVLSAAWNEALYRRFVVKKYNRKDFPDACIGWSQA